MDTQDSAVLLPGTVFHGRYRVVRCIKTGGMGTLYEVLDDKTDTRRALKVMLPGFVKDPDMRLRFEIEARVTGTIESDHVIRVSDAGVDPELRTPFLVMDLLRGNDLGELLAKRRRLSSNEVVMYLHQASLALDKTHAAGFVHRDLKPENLFLTHRDDGSPCIKILDFGIAKVLAYSQRIYGTRAIGTPLYMSPEQARGDGFSIGPCTDVYSLAHMTYTLLVGEAYWVEEFREAMSLLAFFTMVERGLCVPASRRAERCGIVLPAAFDGWFLKAAAAEPEARFQRATDTIAALAESLSVPVPRPSLPETEPHLASVRAGSAITMTTPNTGGRALMATSLPDPPLPAGVEPDRSAAEALAAARVRIRIEASRGSSGLPERPSAVAAREAALFGRTPGGCALHQLRAPPADFTGRGEELAELRGRLSSGGAIIAGLTGQAGVGKTALALKLAEVLTGDYPDAQIDIDLGGSGASPLTPVQVMERVIHAFEPAERLPENEAELAARYRSVLHGKRSLLLLDNARDRGQAEPLVPPAGCLLLITSRQHFTMPGLYARRLDVLDAAESVALVRSIVPRLDQAAAGELAELCGHLPLALRAAASTLADRLDLKPARYIERLHGAQERLKLVESILASNLDLLDTPVRVLWILLGVFPTAFNAAAAASVAGIPIHEAHDQLGELVRRSLLEWDGSAERYRLHELARDFARSRSRPHERHACERRHALHFLEVTRAAGELYDKGGAALMEGLGAFDREWSHIAEAQAWSAANAETDDAAARVCCELPLAARSILALRQHPRERILWNEAALSAAQRLGRRADAGQSLGNLGLAYADLGEARKAIELYNEHLAVARDMGDRNSEGRALGNLGLAYADLGEVRTAIELLEQHLAIARDLGDRRGEGRALGNLGGAYYRLGEPRKAIELYMRQLTIARDLGDRNCEGSALGNLGVAYAVLGERHRAMELGEVRKAVELFEQHLGIARDLGDRQGVAIASWNLGLAYETLGDLARAVDAMQVRVDFERTIAHSDLRGDEAYVNQLRSEVERYGGGGFLGRLRAWLRQGQK